MARTILSYLLITNLCISPSKSLRVENVVKVHTPDHTFEALRNETINCLKEDLYIQGAILIATNKHLLRYYPINDTYERLTDGVKLVSFTQYNSRKILIVDEGFYCLNEYDHKDGSLKHVALRCSGESLSRMELSRINSRLFLPGVQMTAVGALMYPSQIIYRQYYADFLLSEQFHLVFYFYNRERNTLTVIPQVSKWSASGLQSSSFVLLNKNETLLYVFYLNGMFVTNLDTEEYTELALYKDNTKYSNAQLPLSTGNFSTAYMSLVAPVVWLLQDQIAIGLNKNVFAIDFIEEYISILCLDGENYVFSEEELGDDSCQWGEGNSVENTLFYNRSLILTFLKINPPSDYSFNTPYVEVEKGLALKIETSQCNSEDLVTEHQMLSPSQNSYDVESEVTVQCENYYALNSSYDTIKCLSSGKYLADWSSEVLTCTNEVDIYKVEPQSGQRAGGTMVTVAGILPFGNISVILKSNNESQATVASSLSYQRSLNSLNIEMPSKPSDLLSDDFTLEIWLPTANQSSRVLRYPYKYLPDPKVYNVSLTTIKSGGVYGLIMVHNAKSSFKYHYDVMSERRNETGIYLLSEQPCIVDEVDNVKCKFPEINQTSALFLLFGDGILLFNGSMTVLPDPHFLQPSTVQTVIPRAGDEVDLVLPGSHLDLGELNIQYEIFLKSPETSKVFMCAVMLEKITSSSVPCYLNKSENLPTESQLRISVKIGNINQEAGVVIFVDKTETPDNTVLFIAMPIAVVILVAIVTVIFIIVRRKQRKLKTENHFILSEDFIRHNGNVLENLNPDLVATLQDFIIDENHLDIDRNNPLGQGQFGILYYGEYIDDNEDTKKVAVKTLREYEASYRKLERFLSEAVVLRGHDCDHIILTLGVCFPDNSLPVIVLPYMANGDLKAFIRDETNDYSNGDLLNFSLQIANGMQYLAEECIVHRDLAARNCLLDDKFTVKISDFGLSRDIYEKDYYRLDDDSKDTPLPVKWMSIESLQYGEFTTWSDVWSYGILLWELFSHGADPYPDVNPFEIKSYLLAGYRLDKPLSASDRIFSLMFSCWLEDKEARPPFTDIQEVLAEELAEDESVCLFTSNRHVTDDKKFCSL